MEGSSDPVSDVSVASSASNEYNTLQMKCKAYQEELTEVRNCTDLIHLATCMLMMCIVRQRRHWKRKGRSVKDNTSS